MFVLLLSYSVLVWSVGTPTHQYRDDDKGDVQGGRVEECPRVGDVESTARAPLAHFHHRVLFQLHHVQLEADPSAFFELYRTTQAFRYHLKSFK